MNMPVKNGTENIPRNIITTAILTKLFGILNLTYPFNLYNIVRIAKLKKIGKVM